MTCANHASTTLRVAFSGNEAWQWPMPPRWFYAYMKKSSILYKTTGEFAAQMARTAARKT